MATVTTFEELELFKFSREIANKIYKYSSGGAFSKEYALKDQMRRSAGSVMDNIAEGFERGGKKEFIQFLYIAKGSSGELRSQLLRVIDLKYIPQKEAESLYSDILRQSKMIGGFIKYLKESEIKGHKYNPAKS